MGLNKDYPWQNEYTYSPSAKRGRRLLYQNISVLIGALVIFWLIEPGNLLFTIIIFVCIITFLATLWIFNDDCKKSYYRYFINDKTHLPSQDYKELCKKIKDCYKELNYKYNGRNFFWGINIPSLKVHFHMSRRKISINILESKNKPSIIKLIKKIDEIISENV